MNSIKPTQLMVLGGSALLLISTFLDWRGVSNAYESFFFGLQGILILLLCVEMITVSAIQAFAPQVNLPEKLLGYSVPQLTAVAAIAAFLTTFGQWFSEGTEIGLFLAGIGAGVAVAGAVWEMMGTPASGNANPTSF